MFGAGKLEGKCKEKKYIKAKNKKLIQFKYQSLLIYTYIKSWFSNNKYGAYSFNITKDYTKLLQIILGTFWVQFLYQVVG